MSTKISDLTSATSLTGTEEVPIVQTGTTKKTTIGDIQKNSNYSSTEHVVGTWIDGKPLYERTITTSTTSSSTSASVTYSSIGLTNLKYIISIDAIVIRPSDTSTHPLYWKSSTDYFNIFATTTDLAFQSGNQHGFGDIYCTIRYTKTTD